MGRHIPRHGTAPGHLICRACMAEKPEDDFYANAASRTGRTAYCKPCTSVYAANWRQSEAGQANAEKQRQRYAERTAGARDAKKQARAAKSVKRAERDRIRDEMAPFDKAYYGNQASAAVYVLSAGEFVKVGVSHDPESRLSDIQVGCPLPVSLAYRTELLRRFEAQTIEREMHRELADRWASGEWFRVDPETVAARVKELVLFGP